MLMKNKPNIKSDISTIKNYLIEGFYNDPDIKYTIKKINKNTNKLVIDMLKRKKLIDNKYEFKLTLESVEFLEIDLKNFKSYLLSSTSISIACVALAINIFINQDILPFIIVAFASIFFIILFYFGKKL